MRTDRFRFIPLLAICALAIAGCGGDDPPEEPLKGLLINGLGVEAPNKGIRRAFEAALLSDLLQSGAEMSLNDPDGITLQASCVVGDLKSSILSAQVLIVNVRANNNSLAALVIVDGADVVDTYGSNATGEVSRYADLAAAQVIREFAEQYKPPAEQPAAAGPGIL